MSVIYTTSEIVFACHSAACRPPTSGGTGGSNGRGGGVGTSSGGGKRFDTAHRMAIGSQKTLRDGNAIVTVSRSRRGYDIQSKRADTKMSGHSGQSAKTLKEAVEKANRSLDAGGEAATKARAAAYTKDYKERVASRAATIAANPNAPQKMTMNEYHKAAAAIARQGDSFDPSKSRLPAHVKAALALKPEKGSKGYAQWAHDYLPSSVARKISRWSD